MKIMIPLADGKLTAHFGHCQEFACLELDDTTHEILADERVPAPAHQPGLLPTWLAEQGANLVIAGGMGQMAQNLLADQGVEVIVGAPVEAPDALVAKWRGGELGAGQNLCDH